MSEEEKKSPSGLPALPQEIKEERARKQLQEDEKRMKEDQENSPKWFAMRATYRCEQDMKEQLEQANMDFTCFLPLVLADRVIKGRKKRVWVPAVSSLIFVRGVKSKIQEFKAKHPRLQYLCRFTGKNVRTPITVPDQQMADFIKLYEGGNYEITDDPEIINSIKPGQKVRVVEGPFMNLTGTFQRMKGKRSKQFIIKIDQIACITTTEISPHMVEIIEK